MCIRISLLLIMTTSYMYTCTYIIEIKLRSSNVPIPLFHYRSNTDTFQGKLANTDSIPILCHIGITHKKQLTVVNKPATKHSC